MIEKNIDEKMRKVGLLYRMSTSFLDFSLSLFFSIVILGQRLFLLLLTIGCYEKEQKSKIRETELFSFSDEAKSLEEFLLFCYRPRRCLRIES
jgi:hypothetical protein